jgi:hypothetical protein
MSQQQTPQQRPKRPQPPQQQLPGYPQQAPYPPQQGQYPPQYQQMPQAAPTQAPSSNNPILKAIKWLFWPFLKIGGWFLSLFNVIIQEILRSAVRMVFSIILFGIFIAITAAYIIALMQTNYDFSAAIPVMIDNIMGLFGR